MSGDTSDNPHPRSRVIQIVRGDPSDTEIAALTAVVAAVAGAASTSAREPGPAVRRSAWADPAHRLRTAPHPGPGRWRASALPH